jgi:hypothetical protein
MTSTFGATLGAQVANRAPTKIGGYRATAIDERGEGWAGSPTHECHARTDEGGGCSQLAMVPRVAKE